MARNPFFNNPNVVDREEFQRRNREEQARRYQQDLEAAMERAAIRRQEIAREQEAAAQRSSGGGGLWGKIKDIGGDALSAAATGEGFFNYLGSDLGPLGIPRMASRALGGPRIGNQDLGTDIKQDLRQVPFAGQGLSVAFNELANPATLIPGALGPKIGLGAARLGMAGRPIAMFGENAVGGGLGRRLAGESAVGLGAWAGNELAQQALPEGTPAPVRFGVGLGAGLVGAGGAGAGFRGATRGRGLPDARMPQPEQAPAPAITSEMRPGEHKVFHGTPYYQEGDFKPSPYGDGMRGWYWSTKDDVPVPYAMKYRAETVPKGMSHLKLDRAQILEMTPRDKNLKLLMWGQPVTVEEAKRITQSFNRVANKLLREGSPKEEWAAHRANVASATESLMMRTKMNPDDMYFNIMQELKALDPARVRGNEHNLARANERAAQHEYTQGYEGVPEPLRAVEEHMLARILGDAGFDGFDMTHNWYNQGGVFNPSDLAVNKVLDVEPYREGGPDSKFPYMDTDYQDVGRYTEAEERLGGARGLDIPNRRPDIITKDWERNAAFPEDSSRLLSGEPGRAKGPDDWWTSRGSMGDTDPYNGPPVIHHKDFIEKGQLVKAKIDDAYAKGDDEAAAAYEEEWAIWEQMYSEEYGGDLEQAILEYDNLGQGAPPALEPLKPYTAILGEPDEIIKAAEETKLQMESAANEKEWNSLRDDLLKYENAYNLNTGQDLLKVIGPVPDAAPAEFIKPSADQVIEPVLEKLSKPGIGNALRNKLGWLFDEQEPQAAVPMDRTPLDPRTEELLGGDRATNRFGAENGPKEEGDIGWGTDFETYGMPRNPEDIRPKGLFGKPAEHPHGNMSPAERALDSPSRAALFEDLDDEQLLRKLEDTRVKLEGLETQESPIFNTRMLKDDYMHLESKLNAEWVRRQKAQTPDEPSFFSRMSDKLIDIFAPEGPTNMAVKGGVKGTTGGAVPPASAAPPVAPPPSGKPPSLPPPPKGNLPPRTPRPPSHELVEPQIPKPGLTTSDRLRDATNRAMQILTKGGVKEDAVATPISREYQRQHRTLITQGTALEQFGERLHKAFKLDKTGYSNKYDIDIQDMAQNYSQWKQHLTPHEQEMMEHARTMIKRFDTTLKEYGVSVRRPTIKDPEGFYIPRGGKSDKWDYTGVVAGRFTNRPKGTTNKYATKDDGYKAGEEYSSLPEALRQYADEVAKLGSEKWLSEAIQSIGGGQLPIGPAGVGKVAIKGAGNVELPKEIADLINRDMKKVRGSMDKNDFVRLVDNVNRVAKSLWTTFDLSFAGIQGLLGAAINPKAGARAFAMGVRSALDPAHSDQWVKSFDKAQAAKGGLTSTQMYKQGLHRAGSSARGLDVSQGGVLQGFQKIPGIRHASTAFSEMGDAMRLMLAAQAEGTAKAFGKTPDIEGIMKGANRATGFTNANVLGDVGDIALFAPRFLTSQIEMVSKALSPTMSSTEANMARAQLGSLIATGVALTWYLNESRGERTVFDPRDSNFMRIRNLGGTDVSVFGPWDSMVRGLTRSVTEQDPLYLARTKASPAVSLLVDTLTGENIVGEKTRNPEYWLRSLLPLSMRQIGEDETTPTQLATGFFGLKSAPLTGKEELDNRLEDAGILKSDPDYLIKRRDYLAEHPEYRARAGSDEQEAIYDVQDSTQQREAENERRTIDGEQTLFEFRDARKGLLKERRIRLEPLVEDINNKPKTPQEKWLQSYFELFELPGVTDEVTGDIIADKFDEVEAQWLAANSQGAYDFIQRYVLAGTTPVEKDYITDMQTLAKAGYFDIEKYKGLQSDSTEEELETLRQQVTSARAGNPQLREMEFEQAARLLLKQAGIETDVIRDVIHIGKQAAMSDELKAMKSQYGKELLWFNPNVLWEDYQSYTPGQKDPGSPSFTVTRERRGSTRNGRPSFRR